MICRCGGTHGEVRSGALRRPFGFYVQSALGVWITEFGWADPGFIGGRPILAW